MEKLKLLSMLTDYYEFTMSNGYFLNGFEDDIAYFDVFFRKIPDDGGYAVYAGLEQVINFIEKLRFSDEDIDYLRDQKIFDEKFLMYLKDFEFNCDVWSFKEGEVIFPGEPIMVLRGPVIQLQLLETLILVTLNHQSLIATKASRMVEVAGDKQIVEFGARRAQGYSAAYYGARAAYIGGVVGTSNTLAAKDFDIPALGTMAHSWIQFFDSEYEAFKAYCEIYPDGASLLIDTYDVLESGLPNAIKVFDEVVVPSGNRPKSVRIDSGDIAYLSKKIRKRLDEAGYEDVTIMASNSLDEYIIKSLYDQGAKIDSFGIGERLITAKSEPVFGFVYKLSAREVGGEIVNKIKISENVEKITTPGFKQVYRFYDKDEKSPIADLVSLHHEDYTNTEEVEIFHPNYTWKRQTLRNYDARPMLEKIYEKGRLIYKKPSLEEIREFSLNQVKNLWPEQRRLDFPNEYIVDLSYDLWTLRDKLLKG